MENLHKRLFDDYDNYYQIDFENRYIVYNTLKKHLVWAATLSCLSIERLGKSFEGRDIFQLTAGNEEGQSILLWSQMHGDESTATRALLDVFKFFNTTDDKYNEVRQTILKNLYLTFVPMLNPDGAERWQRRTAQDIDMNRDAVCNATAEGQLLQKLFTELKPEYAFNLHDQASYYTAGTNHNPATIALLAPPVDDKELTPENRKRAMQLVCYYNNFLQQYIPECVGKWKDDYEARAFGEHFQRMGAATILIESGGRAGDPEREFARKLNFIMIISGLYAIATGDILNESIEPYKQIPVNVKENIFDILYKNAIVLNNGKQYLCDIGVRRYDKLNEEKQLVPTFLIEDIGDLTPFGAFEIIDVKGKQIINQNNQPILIGKQADFSQ